MRLSKGGNHKVTEKTETFSGQHTLSVTARRSLNKHTRKRWQPKPPGTQGPTGGGDMTAEEREQFEAGRKAAEAAIAAYHEAAVAHTSH